MLLCKVHMRGALTNDTQSTGGRQYRIVSRTRWGGRAVTPALQSVPAKLPVAASATTLSCLSRSTSTGHLHVLNLPAACTP